MNVALHQFFQSHLIELVEAARVPVIVPTPFPDKWIASSTMQKAIRRGDVDLALSATSYLIEHDIRMCKRRIAVTAVEDIGVADTWLVGLAQYASFRNGQLPPSTRYKLLLVCVAMMARSAKDRSADYLQTSLEAHPGLDLMRDKMAEKSPKQLYSVLLDEDRFLVERTMAGWLLSKAPKTELAGSPENGEDPELFMLALERLSIPFWMPFIVEIAGPNGKEPMFWHLPVKVSHVRSGSLVSKGHRLPDAQETRGIPHYALDCHTRLGKQAIRRLLKASEPLSRILASRLPSQAWQATVEGALFNVEAALVDREICFPEYKAIKKLGVETDICRYGLPIGDVPELINCVTEGLPVLDELKREILLKAVKP